MYFCKTIIQLYVYCSSSTVVFFFIIEHYAFTNITGNITNKKARNFYLYSTFSLSAGQVLRQPQGNFTLHCGKLRYICMKPQQPKGKTNGINEGTSLHHQTLIQLHSPVPMAQVQL